MSDVFALINQYEQACNIVIEARIRKLPNGKYRVLSEKGKDLGTYNSRSGAEKRLRQVEFFKHRDQNKSNDKKIDLTDIDDFSYSAILRKLNQRCSKEQVISFMKIFKKYFDNAVEHRIQSPERVALQKTVIVFNKEYPIKLDKNMIKTAAVSELGDPELVGKYLADIIRFTLHRISPERRQRAIARVKYKIHNLPEIEIANKKMPPSSGMGQSINFTKNILFGHTTKYIRTVLNSIVRNL